MHWQSWEKMAVPKSKGGLGFRDLELFNDAMLAKQAWRLLENPQSLCARVLKGRYYPTGDILSAGCPAEASRTWKAIICGCDVLRRGLIRRIGDGMKTEVWHDNWIEGTISMRPLGSRADNSIQLVADLIDPVSGQWLEEVIRETFYAPDAEAILAMPRPRCVQEDFWAWAWDSRGVYSVKSAYRVMADAHVDARISEGTSRSYEKDWKALWKLKVLPKIRVFWWRVAKGMLPCFGELRRRHIKTEANCPMCGCEEETLYHSLLKCDHARKFWDAGRFHFDIKTPNLHPSSGSMDMLNPNLERRRHHCRPLVLHHDRGGSPRHRRPRWLLRLHDLDKAP